jgi:hypothetical protein
MTLRTKIQITAIGLLLALSVVIVRSWLDDRDDSNRLKAALNAQSAVIQQAQQQMQALMDADKRRDAQAQSAIAAMQQAVAKAQTPEQIASWISGQVQTPVPLRVTIPATTTANSSPDAIATIPQRDLPSIRDEIESCKECSVKLQTSEQDLASKSRELQLAGEQLSATQRQRDAAIAATKGGSLWHRLRRNSRWMLFGAATAAAALCISKHCK